MAMLNLALKSLKNRAGSATLTVLTIAISVMLLIGVEQVRTEARTSFANTLSGTDLIVGARTGQAQLLLYSVFHIGNASNNVGWDSYRTIAAHPQVEWTIPLLLGDSHRGFRVVGTSADFFRHYRYGRDGSLVFSDGQPFADLFDVVIGAQVARELQYRLGQEVIIAHGMGNTSFARHDDKPFRIVGILEPTGTPVDRTLMLSPQAVQAIHLDWQSGVQLPGQSVSADEARQQDLTPTELTAFMVGLKSRMSTFALQRSINNYRKEPLLAILPGVALAELWSLMSVAEQALLLVSAAVVFSGLAGLLTVLLAGLNERRREVAILRSLGARPWQVLALLTFEAALLTLLGAVLGMALLYLAIGLSQPLFAQWLGLQLELSLPSNRQWFYLALVQGAGILTGLVPGWRAYRYSLADGICIRI
ncbi:ABC transporter permease [Marinobacterium rhizophilum]|uniref:ABC transporter permease n=1 Tax=Marinobacterium rhizophilum TaxID=420402 RepID=A0ABY5HJA8_9GAMM|nr:ABC transporter permease [Marinobacterium rhizophilum]UTW12462.1 ABC transporter permease [Marinobacterium rhizophilum]